MKLEQIEVLHNVQVSASVILTNELISRADGKLGTNGASVVPGKTYLIAYVREGVKAVALSSGGTLLSSKIIEGYSDIIYICVVKATSSYIEFLGSDNPCIWVLLD